MKIVVKAWNWKPGVEIPGNSVGHTSQRYLRGRARSAQNGLLMWVIVSYRAGENSQLLGIAEALNRRFGWSFETKRLVYRHGGLYGLLRRATLRGIDFDASDPLAEPWPDIIVSAGLRNESVARWIRWASGDRSKIVFIGRTWSPPDVFDLVVTTPQYRVPTHPNVVQNQLTLHRVTEVNLTSAADECSVLGLPRPITAVMIGGNSGPYVFGPRAARWLAGGLNQMEGSLLVSSSARTPASFVDRTEELLEPPHKVYRFEPADPQNPYFDWLARADRICVTADSVALLSEAIATGKPVTVFDPTRQASRDFRLQALLYSWLMKCGPRRWTRDVDLVHERQREDGRISWLEEAAAGHWPPSRSKGADNLYAATEWIAGLLRDRYR